MYSAPFSSKKTPIIMYKQINQIIGYDFRLFYFITATTTQKSSKFVLKKNPHLVIISKLYTRLGVQKFQFLVKAKFQNS